MPVNGVNASPVSQGPSGQGAPVLDLGQDGLHIARENPLVPLGQAPPGGLGALVAVSRECLSREQAALLGEVLEGMTGPQVSVDIALLQAWNTGQDHQVGVGAYSVQGVQLDAAPGGQQGANPRGICGMAVPAQAAVGHQEPAGLVGRQGDFGQGFGSAGWW